MFGHSNNILKFLLFKIKACNLLLEKFRIYAQIYCY
jgi:hypothetical protein